jgi:hypothetical protein
MFSSSSLQHSGIMFPIKAKDVLPVEKIIIHSVAVRGQLGPISVWITNENEPERPSTQGEYNFRLSPRHWTKIYEGEHAPSQRTYQVLDLRDKPIVLRPGQVRSIYIHSTSEGDEAIVYDNSIPTARHQVRPRHEDAMLSIYSGKAHLSPTPFGQMPIWGWGNAWRDHREFVGQLQYGIVYKLWNPELHNRFGGHYQQSVHALLACQRRCESPVSMLPDECLFYILNMCRWDWFQDTPDTLKALRRARKRKLRLVERERQRLEAEQAVAASAPAVAAQQETDGRSCCDQIMSRDGNRSNGDVASASNNRDADGDEEFYDAEEHAHDADVEDANIEDDDDEDEDADAMAVAPVVGAGLNNDGDGDYVDDDDDDDDDDELVDDADDAPEEEDDGEASDESEWERQNGYRADNSNFSFRDVSSDEDDDVDGDAARTAAERQAWFRRHFARVHILRGLAQGEADVVVDMNLEE